MANSETVHAKNAANFETLIAAVKSFGARYNPRENELKIPSLETLLNDARIAIRESDDASEALLVAFNHREYAFEDLARLAARIGDALETGDVDDQIRQDAQTIIAKLQCKRTTFAAKQTTASNSSQFLQTASTARASFNSRLAHFERLIQLLEQQSSSAPDEADLKPAALRSRLHELKSKNTNALAAANALDSARLVCEEVLYDDEIGLVVIAKMVKKYVKSIYGAGSPQCKQIANLRFTKPR